MTRKEALQAAKPILFNTEMVRVILDGRKTVTRRVIKIPETAHLFLGINPETVKAEFLCGKTENGFSADWEIGIKLPYQVGDIFYVREAWNYGYFDTTDFEFQYNETFFEELAPGTGKNSLLSPRYFYRTEDLDGVAGMKWRPSVYMPKEAARIFLRVTGVRVERLQDITDEDMVRDFARCSEAVNAVGKDVLAKTVWNSTVKKSDLDKYGWNANPWVFVIEFERVEVS